jgi:hypothetical protein
MKLPMFNILLSLIALVAAAPGEKPDLESITLLPASVISANPLTARQGLETQETHCVNHYGKRAPISPSNRLFVSSR